MVYATLDEQKQIANDCFNGHIPRDCDECPAHFSNANGICCFGNPEEHDPHDSGCRECSYFDDCGDAVSDLEVQQRKEAERQNRGRFFSGINSRRVARPASERLVQLPTRRSTTTVKDRGTVTNRSEYHELADGETLFQRFMKDSIWGAGQGFFEMAAQFFRTHRLP